MPVQVGDVAPDFALVDTDGRTVRLSDYRGRSSVVLFFYPKDNSPACSAEACTFRDSYQDFVEAGAEVFGISQDDEAEHRKFTTRFGLPFKLLVDPKGQTRKAYGVPKTLGLIPGRVTYVVDPEGVVRHIFNSQFQLAKHVAEALGVLARIKAGQAV